MKSSTQGTTLKQQGFHEVHKKRTFLQDNSWIKKRPEEERLRGCGEGGGWVSRKPSSGKLLAIWKVNTFLLKHFVVWPNFW